ncbi:MAG: acyl-CoA/acyl-ACP dehydrogenase [Proteobacteria bacterium]|nr:acyl-CoA/acyl-ACP dehydrogenase [Pseudomonadota bacterium]MBI3496098.1 acyl-CoA/acyl-ACP dehydrogenase [Pseudomonadota bacterium]
MDFDFSSEQYMFRESIRGFLEESYDLKKVSALMAGEGRDPRLWSKLAELGCFSMLVPEEHGGLGLSFVDLALVIEEFGRALVPAPVVETIVSTDAVARFGTEAQKAQLLPSIAEGKLTMVPAIAEAEAGFSPDDIAMTAEVAGNGWSVSGRKILVPHAKTADVLLVATRFGTDGKLGLVLCEPSRSGVSLRRHEAFDPAGRFYEVSFDRVRIVRDEILGGDPSGRSVERLLDASGAAAAMLMTGVAGKMLDRSIDYAAQRIQFDKPIGSFQAIKHKCADMAVAIEASQSAAYYAAWALAEEAPELTKAVSIAKSFCGDTARQVCNEGIQIHGGIGFTWELGLHLYLRRAKVLEYSYGDAAYHRERVLASALAEIQRRA